MCCRTYEDVSGINEVITSNLDIVRKNCFETGVKWMSKTIYGNLELNGKIFPFLVDGRYVHIVQQAFQNSKEFIEKDHSYIRGVTSDNRDILFLNCHLISAKCDAKTIFSIQGYAMSVGNVGEPCDFSFDRMTFYSDAISTFYSPQNAIDRQLSDFGVFSKSGMEQCLLF